MTAKPPPPPPPSPPPKFGGPNDAIGQVSAPSTALLILGVLYLALAVLGLLANIFGTTFGTLFGEHAGGRFGQLLGGGAAIVLGLIGLGVSALITYAALQMKKLKQWGLCLTGSILVMIPCITPCIGFIAGIPIGIWCIVVLMRNEVKTAFS